MVETNLTTLFQTSLFRECEQFVAEYDLDMTELTDDALKWTQEMKLGRFNKTAIDLPNYFGNLISQYKQSRTKVYLVAHRLDNDLTNWELAFTVRELQEVAEMLSQVINTVKFKKGFKPGNGYHKNYSKQITDIILDDDQKKDGRQNE